MNILFVFRQERIFVLLFVFSSVFFACEGTGIQGRGLMSSSGRSGELLVVCSDNQWKGNLGDSLQTVFMYPLAYLPQNEPVFSLSHIDKNGFSPIYQKQRNIILINVDNNNTEPKITVIKDKWANPQIIVSLDVQKEEDVFMLLSNKKDVIIKVYLDAEMQRFQKAQKAQQDYKIEKRLINSYQLSMVVPEGYIFAVNNENFCWMRKETKYWGQSILIYIQDYSDTSMLLNTNIIKLRNRMTQKYVFGSVDSSYMVVDEKYIPSKSEYYNFNGHYSIKTQGLWKMAGDFMGGPFVSYSILDEKKNRIVTVDGFLYAPTDDKRDLLRQVEAILLSTKLLN